MIEERAEKHYNEMEKERRALEFKLESRRMEMETCTNERLMTMFSSLMQQMIGGGACLHLSTLMSLHLLLLLQPFPTPTTQSDV